MGIFWCISITYNVNSCKKYNENAQTAKFTVFAREISSAVLKTWKTRKTKKWITQNFQIIYHIQGGTNGKMTSWGFRKSGTFWVYDFLKGSFWLSKSSQILKKWVGGGVKKKTQPQFWFFGHAIESALGKPTFFGPDSTPALKTQNCGRVFFFTSVLDVEKNWNITKLWQPITPL